MTENEKKMMETDRKVRKRERGGISVSVALSVYVGVLSVCRTTIAFHFPSFFYSFFV